jgi:hypothetical protein
VPDRVDITDADRARFECDCQGCRKHSFDPDTPVLMADGTTKAIKDVEVGDEVVATDPETGETSAQPVTDLHVNLDRELTTLTLASLSVLGLRTIGEGEGDRSTRGPTEAAVSTLETTQNHPFWDVAADEWVDAADLVPGRSVVTSPTGERQLVVAVDNYTGAAEMRDLTVATIHTYYVVAGDTPVLVHNTPVLVHNSNCDTFGDLQNLRSLVGSDVTARLDIGDRQFFGWNDPTHTGSIPGRWSFFSQHAEGQTFLQALDAGVQGGHARLYVLGRPDPKRDPCGFCRSDISGMARMLGLDSLEVVTPQGVVGVFTREAGRMKWSWP